MLAVLATTRRVGADFVGNSDAAFLARYAGVPPVVGIDDRATTFFEDVIRFIQTIAPAAGTVRLIEQLVQSSGSIPSNREEATSASSKKEFIRFNKIALRSAKESTVWLRGCRAGKWGDQEECRRLIDESQQITRILAAIVIKAQRNV